MSLLTVWGTIIAPCCGRSHMTDFVFGMHVQHVCAVSLTQLCVMWSDGVWRKTGTTEFNYYTSTSEMPFLSPLRSFKEHHMSYCIWLIVYSWCDFFFFLSRISLRCMHNDPYHFHYHLSLYFTDLGNLTEGLVHFGSSIPYIRSGPKRIQKKR